MRRQLAALVLALSLPWPAQAAEVVVRPGETLSEIAARAGISTERLMQINGIRNADLIVAGQRLTVPGGSQRSAGGNRGTTTTPGRVTIRQGETLSEISVRYGVSVERLMQLNGITDPTRVVAGDSLQLRAPTPPRRNAGVSAGGGTTVIVRPGETLSEIAERHNVSMERLVQLNRLQNPSQLMAGDRLVISTRPPAGANRPGTSSGARVYVVQPGDTLSEIANDTRVPVQRLVSLNNLQDPDDLIVGTRLKLTAPPPVPRSRPRTGTRPRPRATTPTVARTPSRPASTTAASTVAPTTTASATTTASLAPGSSTAATAPTRTSVDAGSTSTPAATTSRASATSTVGTATAPTIRATTTAPTRTPQTSAATGAGPATTGAPAAAAGSPSSSTATPTATVSTTATGPRPATSASPVNSTTRELPASRASTTVATASQRPTSTATAATTRPRTAPTSRAASPDWRTYGPMQVDWASWQTMGGSYVAPVLTSTGQPFYLAINCGARKLNTTGATGQWKTWENPQSDFEQSLLTDLCRLKGG